MILIILWFRIFLQDQRSTVALWDDLAHPMMNYALSARTQSEVHQKIVKDASRRVRAEGLSGAAVAAVMRDTGLTHGGFYKHFGSKDELVMESLREAFRLRQLLINPSDS
jgi:AcrR family transcriptional regulator